MRTDICILIPTYNNADTLLSVITQTLQQGYPVIVINDGSTDNTSNILKSIPDITTFSYHQNQGKGYALQYGFKKALELGYKYCITLDSDGQHSPENISLFVDKLDETGECLIIGERNMNQNGIPLKSNFGRKFSNFWFWVETWIKSNDTQSGFRLYPLVPISKIKFFTKKFEFEIEVIVRLAWDNVPVKSVPVQVKYMPEGERISHFRPLKDFTRISILNTILVIAAYLFFLPRLFYLRLKSKPWKELLLSPEETTLTKASSIGFGVFMGIIPVWGFQMMIAFALSIPLRLNKVLVLLASNISIVPMMPVIIFASLWTGHFFVNSGTIMPYSSDLTFSNISNMLLQYIIGSIVLAITAGITFFCLTYLILKLARKK